jgi:hypothetical protein
MPTPHVLTSVVELSRLVRGAPSVIVDLTPLGSIHTSAYRSMWPAAQVYAYCLEPADEPGLSPVPLPLSDAPNWGARVNSAHGVLGDIRTRELVGDGASDQALASTIDIFADEHKLGQIGLLVLPASWSALPALLGASNLLATASIPTVAILGEPETTTPAGMLLEVAGILSKFGYRWATIDGAATSVAEHDAEEEVTVPIWLQAAESFLIHPEAVIHVGEFEARDRELYRQHGVMRLFVVGQNAKAHERLIARAAGSVDQVYPSINVATLDQLGHRHDVRECNALHVELAAIGLLGLSGSADTLRHIEIINVELKHSAGNLDSLSLQELDITLRARGFRRISVGPSTYPSRKHAVYVRQERLWAHDPLKATGIALQHANASIRSIGYVGRDAGDRLSASVSFADYQQLLPGPLSQVRQDRAVTQLEHPIRPPAIDPLGPQGVVTYVLHHNEQPPRQAEDRDDSLPPEVDVIVLLDQPTGLFFQVLDSVKSSTRLSAIVVLGSVGDGDMAQAISTAFDHGFLLDRSTAASTGRIFIRSDLIREPGRWFQPDNHYGTRQFHFSLLGRLGRFGNQLFQLWHLVLSGLRHNATVSSCLWEWQQYFALESVAKEGSGDFLRVESYDWRVMGLWALDSLPDGIDFWGHFQWIPPFLHRHRVFLSRLFDLRPEWTGDMATIIASLRAAKRPLTVFHVRRGDYVNHPNSGMREIPIAWYRAALEPLRDTTIYAGSDDLEFVRRAFSDVSILSSEDFADSRLPAPIIDHCVMRAADTLLVINSSYSRTAAMMAKDQQAAWLPSMHQQVFQSYAPWSDPMFWFRFESDDPDDYARRVAELQHWLDRAGLSD